MSGPTWQTGNVGSFEMESRILSEISSTLLLNQIGDAQFTPIAIKDLEHRFVYANEAFCKASGCRPRELIGKTDLEAGRSKTLVLGDEHTGWPGFWALDKQAVDGVCPTISMDTNSGRHLATETLRTPILDDAGEVVALMVQLHDVSEVRELKRRVASNLDALSIRDGEITAIDSVLVTLMACQDTHSLVTQLVDVLVEQTRADAAFVATVQEAEEYMEIVAVSGERTQAILGTTFKQNEGIMGRAWHANKPVFIKDTSTQQSLFYYQPGTQAFSVLLSVDGETVGALTVTSDPESPDLSSDIALLERIGGMASIAIANTHLIDATKRSLRGTHALAEVSRILPGLDDTIAACDVVCRSILPAVEATRASVYLVDSKGELAPQASWGSMHDKVNRTLTLPPELTAQCIAQWSVNNNKSAHIGRLDEDPRESAAVHATRWRMNIGSTYCLPLRLQDMVIGALLISRSRNKRNFSDTDIDLFKAVVNQLATSIERVGLSHELQHQAFHDQLTSLPNRHSFELELERTISKNDNTANFSMLFIDLDGFKEVNDSYGHGIGDQLLRQVAERLHNKMSDKDILARMGGDEFAVILHGKGNDLEVAKRLLACLDKEFPVARDPLRISASIGISRYPDNGQSADTLLQSADEAMYQAKRSGKGCVVTFNESLAVETRERAKLVSQLQEAITRQEFVLVYQPQVRCSDDKVVGLEALIRWRHPTRGMVPPDEFIPVAESTGLINKIGAWVIDEAVRQLAVWQLTLPNDLRVSVNIAAPQFQQDDFCDQVFDALERHSVSASRLELEVTESVVMQNIPLVVERLHKLRSTGLRIAIDDFGTGYSSLSYLQDLPLDVLKIDRTFIQRLYNESSQTSLVNTILLLATGLGLETVAEGVELIEQCETVKRLGCDLIQGYLYSPPVTADQIPATIQSIESPDNAALPLISPRFA